MAFEIYSRKKKPLLMLQSIKRAHRLDPNNPKLHSYLILYHGYLTRWQGSLDASVATVLKQEMEPIFRARDPHQMNAEFLAANSDSLEALLESARMMYHLDPSQQEAAIKLATTLDKDIEGVNLQNCTKVLQALKNGEFGSCPEQFAEYKAHCHVQFPYAQVFRPPSTSCQSSPTTESNHISDGKENCVSN